MSHPHEDFLKDALNSYINEVFEDSDWTQTLLNDIIVNRIDNELLDSSNLSERIDIKIGEHLATAVEDIATEKFITSSLEEEMTSYVESRDFIMTVEEVAHRFIEGDEFSILIADMIKKHINNWEFQEPLKERINKERHNLTNKQFNFILTDALGDETGISNQYEAVDAFLNCEVYTSISKRLK